MLFGRMTTADLVSHVWRDVACSCGTEYVYRLERTGHGSASSSEWTFLTGNESAESEAHSLAEQELQERLDNDHELMACPTCGRYQPEMIDADRWRGWGLSLRRAAMRGLLATLTLPVALCVLSVAADAKLFTLLAVASVFLSVPVAWLLVGLSFLRRQLKDYQAGAAARVGAEPSSDGPFLRRDWLARQSRSR